MGGIDNYAHAGGFVGGYAAAIWLDPLKRERTDHLALAFGCLVATALAILASLIDRSQLLGVARRAEGRRSGSRLGLTAEGQSARPKAEPGRSASSYREYRSMIRAMRPPTYAAEAERDRG